MTQSFTLRLLINENKKDVDGDKFKFTLRYPSANNFILEYSRCQQQTAFRDTFEKVFCPGSVAARMSVNTTYKDMLRFFKRFLSQINSCSNILHSRSCNLLASIQVLTIHIRLPPALSLPVILDGFCEALSDQGNQQIIRESLF